MPTGPMSPTNPGGRAEGCAQGGHHGDRGYPPGIQVQTVGGVAQAAHRGFDRDPLKPEGLFSTFSSLDLIYFAVRRC
ncbi:hypothetical protein DESC_460089 [Desulfosarcina cetonica]|nr:hypothetical protein DESC_460089 [Desulfosarcina cetonica]